MPAFQVGDEGALPSRATIYGKMTEFGLLYSPRKRKGRKAPQVQILFLPPFMEDTEVGSLHCLENSSAAKTAIVRCDYLPPFWKVNSQGD